MPDAVFTYGSLMFAPVWSRVVRGVYRSLPARLHGYQRHAVRDATYPGIFERVAAQVIGCVYLDMQAKDIVALDIFEGIDYARRSVSVELENGTQLTAETYVFLPIERLSDAPWQPEQFALQEFLDRYCQQRD